MEEQHIYHHDDTAPEIKLKAERLQKGFNTEVTVTCNDANKALELLASLVSSMTTAYPPAPTAPVQEKDKTK